MIGFERLQASLRARSGIHSEDVLAAKLHVRACVARSPYAARRHIRETASVRGGSLLPCRQLVILASALALVTASVASADDANDVQEAFSSYRSAILAGNGNSAVRYLSSSTFEYYDEMRMLALGGDLETVQGLSLINQMQVLMLRLRVPAEQLGAMTSQELVAHSVDEGWIGKNSVLSVQPGRVISEEDIAVVHAIVDGKDAGPAFRFHRESGAWRLDLIPTIQAANASLQTAVKRSGVSEREFMLTLIESVVGRKVGPEAWEPLRQAP